MREIDRLEREMEALFENALVSMEASSPTRKQPRAVPDLDPPPFAEPPPRGSYWPVITSEKEGRSVAFRAIDGSIEGARGRSRMFLANRKGKRDGEVIPRWHVGVDLFARIGDPVVACEGGEILSFRRFYRAKSGQLTYRILIEHSTAVVNYGEVTSDSLKRNNLEVSSQVQAGQRIGFVSDTSMLHFETYTKGTTRTYRRWQDQRKPPSQLLNPTKYLLFLKEYGLPDPGVQILPKSSPTKSTSGIPLIGSVQDALLKGKEYMAISLALLQGNRDDNALTNMIFYARHPELRGQKLRRKTPESREWLQIRNEIVRPALRLALSLGSSTGGASGKSASTVSGSCPKEQRFRKTIKSKKGKSFIRIWGLPGDSAMFFKAGMAIDADGAPNAYHPKNIGIDYNGNAGYPPKPGKRPWGIVVDSNGRPYIQRAEDPFPGYFVSPTSLVDRTKARRDPKRYVDSTRVPYIALPKAFRKHLGVSLGDFAAVINGKNGKFAYAIFADGGPAYKLGEGSIALAQALGHNPHRVRRGIERVVIGISNDIVYIVFPGSGQGQGTIPTLNDINRQGERSFRTWGGLEQVYSCFPEYAP